MQNITNYQLWEILVPAYLPNGTKISKFVHNSWDQFVRDISGGLTISRSVKGQWVSSDGILFDEKNDTN